MTRISGSHVNDYVVALNAEEWADHMVLRREAIPLRIARLPLLAETRAVKRGKR